MPAGSEIQQHDEARGKHELEARRKFGKHHIERRPLVDIGLAEIALRRVPEIARKLRGPRRIEAELDG